MAFNLRKQSEEEGSEDLLWEPRSALGASVDGEAKEVCPFPVDQ